jgi:hypothetical protein
MLKGEISTELPFIKKVAMDILRNNFPDKDTAFMAIRSAITDHYRNSMPDFYEKNISTINGSIEAITLAYSGNTFPHMKVAYDVYPDHIGHLETEGCFRCHNDLFVSESGKKITKDCNLCHTIAGQGIPGKMTFTGVRDSLEFVHPVDIGTAWYEANCSECHRYLY